MDPNNLPFVDWGEQKQLLVFNKLKDCFTDFNAFAPVFISDFTMQNLKKNITKTELLSELGNYIKEFAPLKDIVDWIFDLIDNVQHGKEDLPLPTFTTQDSLMEDRHSISSDSEDDSEACQIISSTNPKLTKRQLEMQSSTRNKVQDTNFKAMIKDKLQTKSNKETVRKRKLSNNSNIKVKKLKTVHFNNLGVKEIQYGVAIQGYSPPSSIEGFITFKRGDIFNILYASPDLNGWCIALSMDNKEGIVPESFIKRISKEESIERYRKKQDIIHEPDCVNEDSGENNNNNNNNNNNKNKTYSKKNNKYSNDNININDCFNMESMEIKSNAEVNLEVLSNINVELSCTSLPSPCIESSKNQQSATDISTQSNLMHVSLTYLDELHNEVKFQRDLSTQLSPASIFDEVRNSSPFLKETCKCREQLLFWDPGFEEWVIPATFDAAFLIKGGSGYPLLNLKLVDK
jgi:hypothetical protein